MVPVALGALGIQVEGDGSAEYALMDENYRGVVQFRDFRRFVARRQSCSFVVDDDESSDGDEDASNSSPSSCSLDGARELWREIDP